MTVEELIAHLKTFSPSLEVKVDFLELDGVFPLDKKDFNRSEDGRNLVLTVPVVLTIRA